MSAHTEGPWHVDPKRKFRVFAGVDTTIGSFGSSSEIRDQWQTNAALCAAAPDLLEALKKAAKFIAFVERTKATSGAPFGLEQEIEDAIAKATRVPEPTQKVSK